MGVVNITADSFSDGGRFLTSERAAEQALRLLRHGAEIIDLGAESTRPGSRAGEPLQAAVSAQQEQDRLLPVLEMLLRHRPATLISIDTYKAQTARATLLAGAEIINDVSGLTWDAAMSQVCAEEHCGVVLMHTRGRPDEWLHQPPMDRSQMISLVREGLSASLREALSAGISPAAIVLDPGYGFGKRMSENFTLLHHQAEFLALGCPLLVGLSRKSFLRHALASRLGREVRSASSMENAGVSAMTAAILAGASIVRVHSARAATEAAAIADALLEQQDASGDES